MPKSQHVWAIRPMNLRGQPERTAKDNPAPKMKQPIFIIGNPRSGTTLLRLMLNAHSQILVPPECGFAVWLLQEYEHWTLESCHNVDLDIFLNALFRTRKFATWELNYATLRAAILESKPESYPDLVSLIYSIYGQTHGVSFTRWGDKNNFYLEHVDKIDRMFPAAFYLYIVRDGRDVACSYREINGQDLKSRYAPNLPHEINAIAYQWVLNDKKILQSFQEINNNKLLYIRYEDIVREPRKTLTSICGFIGEDFEENMIEYYKEANMNEPKEYLGWKHKVTGRLDRSTVGRYKRDLTPSQIYEFNRVAGEVLVRYGYQI